MSRSIIYRPVVGSVSAIAMVTFLSACSQPASHATVDLGGSNSGNYQTAAQGYSPNGQPIYNTTAQLGPQSLPQLGQYQPNSQYAARNVPGNQVASLGNGAGGFDTYGILNQQRPQQSFPVQSSPSFQQRQLLSSPQIQREAQGVNQAFEDSARLAAPAPFEPAPFKVAPFDEAESLADLAPFEREGGSSSLEVAPVETGSAVRNSGRDAEDVLPRRSRIEEQALDPIAPRRNRDIETVGEDYATIPNRQTGANEDREQVSAPARPRYQPWLAPQFGSQEQQARRIQRPPAVRERVRAEAPVEPKGPDSDFERAARDLLPQRPQQTRLPSPSAVPPAPSRLGAGLNVPKASAEYPRPFELLRPGVWPELENPGVGLVQAPAPTPLPQFASFEPPVVQQSSEAIQSASERGSNEYKIKAGDTLLTIATGLGITPQALAAANQIDLEADIYIGEVLKVPTREAEKSALPTTWVADAPDPSYIGGPKTQTIDTATANKAWGQQKIQQASAPAYRVTTLGEPAPKVQTASTSKRFSWPVHGKVYRLDSGRVEIEAEGNAPVAASAAGRVVHVERGAKGVLVVIEHDNGWRSLTVGLDYSAVRPGQVVAQGATIGKSSREHRVRFELRDAGAARADALQQLRG